MSLAHPLDGIQAKLERADESINNLNAEINQFLTSNGRPYVISSGFDTDPLKYVFKAKSTRPVPLRFSVLTGEIVHQFRSCFDHLVVQLAAKSGQRPLNNHQFPICRKREKFKKSVSGGQVKGVSHTALRRVISAQPYRHATPDDTTINAIHQLDIRDKHSLLLVTCQAAQISGTLKVGSPTQDVAITALGEPGPWVVSEDEVEVFSITLESPAPDFRANAEFSVNVAIQNIGSAQVVPLIPTLTKMAAFTRKTIFGFKDLL